MTNQLFKKFGLLFCSMGLLWQAGYSQGIGGDFLNEVPINPIPASMTFEEYQDMNRRLTVGMALFAIPIPGMIHYYAGEKRSAKILFGTALVGVGSILMGASNLEQGDFPTSDFDLLILNPGDDKKERQYEKIPTFISGTDTTYKLNEIYRKETGGSGGLIVLGAALIIGEYLYDYIHGIRTIEMKRDRVRYKYGQMLEFSMSPQIDPYKNYTGLNFALEF